MGISRYKRYEKSYIEYQKKNKDKIRLSKIRYRKNNKEEIKYQLLCANCNWIKRFENKEWGGAPKRHI